jgi:dUTP pyrophosphatase
MLRVKIKRFPHAEGLELPFYATPGSVGMDLLYAGLRSGGAKAL